MGTIDRKRGWATNGISDKWDIGEKKRRRDLSFFSTRFRLLVKETLSLLYINSNVGLKYTHTEINTCINIKMSSLIMHWNSLRIPSFTFRANYY